MPMTGVIHHVAPVPGELDRLVAVEIEQDRRAAASGQVELAIELHRGKRPRATTSWAVVSFSISHVRLDAPPVNGTEKRAAPDACALTSANVTNSAFAREVPYSVTS
jgi:hypothetical protein